MSDNSQPASPSSKSLKRLIVALVLVAIVASATVAAYSLSSPAPQNPQPSAAQTHAPSNSPQATYQVYSPSPEPTFPSPSGSATPNQENLSWMVKGAYATYQGNTSMTGFDMNFTAKLIVVDLNSTHAQIKTEFNVSTSLGSYENDTTTWVEKTSTNFQPAGLNLTRTYSAQVTIPNLGTRNCIAYEYASEGMNATYYVDTTIHWPIKMVLTSPPLDGESYSMDIILVDTNIVGL